MYIAGLHLPISTSQVLEAFVLFSGVDFLRHLQNHVKATTVHAESKGGHIRADTVPILGQIITVLHVLAAFVPPVIYTGALVFNKLEQPTWMARFVLPDEIAGARLDPLSKGVLRLGACVAGLALKRVLDSIFYHLGEQWHSIGRRERPRVIQTGPYAWVRHPLYTTVLLQEALLSIMFWSYASLVALGIIAGAFAVKMPIEEAMIERDEGIRNEYREYKKKVSARIIPHVW